MTRWYPGVLQAIIEQVQSKSSVSTQIHVPANIVTAGKSVKDLLAKEASQTLEYTRNLQINATKEKSLSEIKKELGMPVESIPETPLEASSPAGPAPTSTRRRVRQKMRSTPVTGGSLFDDNKSQASEESKAHTGPVRFDGFSDNTSGQVAELVVGGEVFNIRVMPQTIQRIRSGYSGELLDDASVRFSHADVPIEHRLQGFIRTGLPTISEDVLETISNHPSDKDSDW